MKLNTLFFTLIVFARFSQPLTQIETKSSFQFTIYGNAKNADGVTLALYIPSRGLDNRITSEVVDGKYFFKGSAKFIERAEIRFEENIVNPSNIVPFHPILIEPDSINFDIEIGGDPMLRRIANFQLQTGPNNIYYYEVAPHLHEISNTWIFSNPIKADSMHQYVYPGIKRAVITTLDSIVTRTNHPEVVTILFNQIFDNSGAFEFNRFNDTEKDVIKKIFEKLEPSSKQSLEYQIAERNIQAILSNGKSGIFKNYSLLSADNSEMKLSSIGESNNYTVLYFWQTGCAPCRKFNRAVKPKHYEKLKNKGIELVSINTDESIERWRKASERDGISWINLYAGPVSGIQQDYGVRGYPTKVILNKEFEFVDFDFSTLSELMVLSK